MATIDLDAARAARREAQGEAPVVVFQEQEFTLPVEMPIGVARLLNGDVIAGMEALLGDQWPRFEKLGPSMGDVVFLFQQVVPVYGLTMGEAGASSPSSTNGSGRSRPTSNGSTGLTLPPPATAPSPSGQDDFST